MMQFKTVALPATEITVKEKDMYTLDTANKVLAPIGAAIQAEARGGWSLHSYVVCPGKVRRKKKITEILLGWIPIVGALFQSKEADFITAEYYMLIFCKEA